VYDLRLSYIFLWKYFIHYFIRI